MPSKSCEYMVVNLSFPLVAVDGLPVNALAEEDCLFLMDLAEVTRAMDMPENLSFVALISCTCGVSLALADFTLLSPEGSLL